MDNYNEFIELLKSFKRENNIGENEDEHSPSILYNGFSCENLDDISTYRLHLENLCSKALSDIKRSVDKLIIERDNGHMLDIFFNGKLNDFKEVEEIINQRDTDNEKRRIKYHIAALDGEYNGVSLDADGIAIYNQFRDAVRGEELYYRNSIDREGLLEYCLSETELFKSNANIFFILTEKEQRDITKKAKQKLEELHYLYCLTNKEEETNKAVKINIKQEKDFRSYLHHDNKAALMEKLHELLDGERGKIVAITIKALEKLGFIAVLSQRAALYKSMADEFGDIGASQGLNKFYNELSLIDTKDLKLKQLNEEVQHQMEILSKVR